MKFQQVADVLMPMRRDTLDNYVIPGLSSSLLNGGKIRLFECHRTHQEHIVPHSHRFNFACYVLEGSVLNRVWTPNENGDLFHLSKLTYCDEPGEYTREHAHEARYGFTNKVYKTGDWYTMQYDEIHSIEFHRGTKVIFFEGPMLQDYSFIMEPICHGKHIFTMKVEAWMFQPRDGL